MNFSEKIVNNPFIAISCAFGSGITFFAVIVGIVLVIYITVREERLTCEQYKIDNSNKATEIEILQTNNADFESGKEKCDSKFTENTINLTKCSNEKVSISQDWEECFLENKRLIKVNDKLNLAVNRFDKINIKYEEKLNIKAKKLIQEYEDKISNIRNIENILNDKKNIITSEKKKLAHEKLAQKYLDTYLENYSDIQFLNMDKDSLSKKDFVRAKKACNLLTAIYVNSIRISSDNRFLEFLRALYVLDPGRTYNANNTGEIERSGLDCIWDLN